MIFSTQANQTSQPFILPDLPYNSALMSLQLSAESFEFHHGKHHRAYVTNLNKLLESTSESIQVLHTKSLEEIVLFTHNKAEYTAIFNNAAQIWNHTFFWHCISPVSIDMPPELIQKIQADFGSHEAFVKSFHDAAISQFGSGWVWLVVNNDGKLKILKTSNADTPITSGYKPLFTCDVWEHAYYIDYRNRRADFVNDMLSNLVNWEFVNTNLTNATQ